MKTPTEQIEQLQTLLKTLNLPTQLYYTKKQVADIIGISTVTLDRMKKSGVGLDYRKIVTGGGKNGRVLYPIDAIARFYFDNVKTA